MQHVAPCRYLRAPPPFSKHKSAGCLAFVSPSTRSRAFSTPSRGPRSRAASRSSSLGGDGDLYGDEERRPLFAGVTASTNGAALPLSHGSLANTTAANTTSNTMSSVRGTGSTGDERSGDERSGDERGGGGGSGNGNSNGDSTAGLPRFSKPTKAVSFAGDDDRSDGSGAALDRNGCGDGGRNGRAALEDSSSPDHSPDRSPARSPLRGSRLAVPPQGYGGVGSSAVSSDNDGAPGGVVQEGLVPGSDEYGWGFSETAGSTTSSTRGVSGGGEEDGDEEGEMANFIVLDCSKVTNVSGGRRKIGDSSAGLVEVFHFARACVCVFHGSSGNVVGIVR